jgi:hypothetical protein
MKLTVIVNSMFILVNYLCADEINCDLDNSKTVSYEKASLNDCCSAC